MAGGLKVSFEVVCDGDYTSQLGVVTCTVTMIFQAYPFTCWSFSIFDSVHLKSYCLRKMQFVSNFVKVNIKAIY